ncbi:MAG: hypothetical protein H6811_06070 [Phycisphaeraceae bacterium]|nr:hypothetical protein [Phycisphaeraceae bacterium]
MIGAPANSRAVCRRGASSARNLVGLIVLVVAIGAIFAVLSTRAGPAPEIGAHEIFFAAPDSPEAQRYGAAATLIRVPVKNPGPARSLRIIVTLDTGGQSRTIETVEEFEADQQRDVILSAGNLPPGSAGVVRYDVEVRTQ